ncbi:MAG: hypothetical protein FWF70_05675, partial [Bacteroidetes bacterium]|nr:hypothetical protein [Bacteroidota bacterium]
QKPAISGYEYEENGVSYCASATENLQQRYHETESACGWQLAVSGMRCAVSGNKDACGWQCRQAVQTRLCGGIPADLTFWLLFWSSKKVEEENMNGRLYDPVIARFFSPDKYVANSSFTQDFNRYTYARNCPLMYTDPDGNEFLFFIFPTFSWSKDGGFSIGITAGIGIPSVFSAQISLGYSFKNNDFSIAVSASAALNTVYASFGTQSGFNAGWAAGLTPYAFPISTNFFTVGANYNFKYQTVSANVSAFYYTYGPNGSGWSFNPSVSAAIYPEQFTNLVKGGGFRSNEQVFERMMSGTETCQDILDYFGFKGTYAPSKTGGYPGVTDDKTGKIFYGDFPFQGNYDRLALIAYHELRHSRNVLAGKYKDIDLRDDINRPILNREEWDTYLYNYRNQGLYPNPTNVDLIKAIKYYGYQIGVYGPTTFSPAWWHFIYKIPRLW